MFDVKKKTVDQGPRGGVAAEFIWKPSKLWKPLRLSCGSAAAIKSLIKAIPSAPDFYSMIVAARMEGE
jgi:hypothetical protein